jgi:glutamine---fructose-6-phosphate transaminase (isomerizing)
MSLLSEARETAAAARRQREQCADAFAELGRRLRTKPPTLVVTCARGSSDHAATYGKYLLETAARTVVASVGPSVASMYQSGPAALNGALFIAVSQSGQSPDLVALTQSAKRAGACTVGLINAESSPLADACDIVIPLCAGEEKAVAATKSFLLSAYAFLQIAAAWTDGLEDAVVRFPDVIEAATPWDVTALAAARSMFVVGRGVGLGAAQEIALKLKETCRLHAEAFSTAEVLHGPTALVEPGFPVLAITQADETETSTRDVLTKLVGYGAQLHEHRVDAPATIAPLVQVYSFYLGVSALAAARGLDADAPVHLRKVTETR